MFVHSRVIAQRCVPSDCYHKVLAIMQILRDSIRDVDGMWHDEEPYEPVRFKIEGARVIVDETGDEYEFHRYDGEPPFGMSTPDGDFTAELDGDTLRWSDGLIWHRDRHDIDEDGEQLGPAYLDIIIG